ncbi:MAG: DNA alkylation repair protein [Dehalococcoidales bacterium]
MPADILSAVRRELTLQADEKTIAANRRFFKEAVAFYGVRTPAVEQIARRFYPQIKPLGKPRVFALCEDLFKSAFIEESFIACAWAYRFRDDFVPADFPTFERWLAQYVTNWAACDTLCNHTLGAFVEKYPQFLADLKQWTKSANRWLRRAAAVTLILPARQGKFLPDILLIADSLLADPDDLVQKGYGWMLKEASKPHQAEVFDYIMKHKATMPRTALRYAIEKMPPDLKRRAMDK